MEINPEITILSLFDRNYLEEISQVLKCYVCEGINTSVNIKYPIVISYDKESAIKEIWKQYGNKFIHCVNQLKCKTVNAPFYAEYARNFSGSYILRI